MINKKSKYAIVIAILFELILMGTIIFSLVSKQKTNLFLLLGTMFCILIPFIITYITNKIKLLLPASFQYYAVIFIILALYFGEFLKFYTIFWWWDLFLHFTFGCYGVIIFIHLLKGIIQKTNSISIRRFAIFSVISAFCFSISLGTLWEIAEFLSDYFLKTNTVNGGLEDTATDLMVKVIGAFITCVILYNTKLKKVKIN